MTTPKDMYAWPEPIAELLARVPLFDGFPYFSTRLVPAAYHITLLPNDWARDRLIDALRRQVAANQLSTALVLSADEALYLSPGNEPCGGPAPRSDITLAGGLLTSTPLTVAQLNTRAERLGVLVARTMARGGTLLGDLGMGGHRATPHERASLGGRRPAGARKGVQRCDTCGDWRGACLARIPDFPRDWVVPVHCTCDNVTCCARCGEALRDRRVGGNHLDDNDSLSHWPGFMALGHTCRLAVETDRIVPAALEAGEIAPSHSRRIRRSSTSATRNA